MFMFKKVFLHLLISLVGLFGDISFQHFLQLLLKLQTTFSETMQVGFGVSEPDQR